MRRLLTFADICSCFRASGRPVQILGLEGGQAQRPQGCLAVIPEGARVVALSFAPEEYFNKGCWELHDRSAAPYLSWRYEGKANAKIGCGCAQVTGRAGALRRWSAGDWVLVVLEFPVFRDMYYSDAIAPQQAGDQVFQAWDGFGFGELEYHGPAVGHPPLPPCWEEKARVWAFGGSRDRISQLTRQLLGLEPEQLLEGGSF